MSDEREPTGVATGQVGRGQHWCSWKERLEAAKVPVYSDHATFLLDEPQPPSSFIIPKSRVKRHILRDEHIRALLSEHRVPERQSSYTLQGLTNDISQSCSIVFCLLLFIERPNYIEHFVRERSLHDDKLELQSPASGPVCLSEEEWNDFLSFRWHFIPYTARKQQETLRAPYIFPYIECKPLGSGASSIVRSVEIHCDYDELGDGLLDSVEGHASVNGSQSPTAREMSLSPDTPASSIDQNRVYALKVFKGPAALKRFTAETRAFNNIRGSGHLKWPAGLIRYYGAYTIAKSEINCIWLEAATGGTLMHMFKNEQPPIKSADVYEIWSRLFELLEGLAALHNLGRREESTPDMHCAHLDIHPRNIVRVIDELSPAKAHSALRYRYKLVDLGHSSTVPRTANRDDKEPKFPDTKAGREYSAPEVTEQIEMEKRASKRVTTVSDVFPLGACFLDAAIWVVLGAAGVDDFASDRAQECRAQHNMAPRFHTAQGDDSQLLHVVARYFDAAHLQPFMRQSDQMTTQVLELVRRMLSPDVEHRMKATTARQEALRLLRINKADPERSSTQITMIQNSRTLTVIPQNNHVPESQSATNAEGILESGIKPLTLTQSPTELATELHEARPADLNLARAVKETTSSPSPISGLSTEDLETSQPSTHQNHPSRRTSHEHRITINDVLAYIDKKKRSRIQAYLRGFELSQSYKLNDIGKRDFVFLIDASESMRDHHKDGVVRAFTALAYKVKNNDDDGIELHYANDQHIQRSKKTRKLIQDIRDRQFQGRTRLKDSLLEPIRKCKQMILRDHKYHGMSIIVLTDGKWEDGADVEELIVNTAKWLQQEYRDRKALCITFVSFGTDKEAIARMIRLDDLKELGCSPLDFVDHEPYEGGDYYKMILGGIDSEYDRRYNQVNSVSQDS